MRGRLFAPAGSGQAILAPCVTRWPGATGALTAIRSGEEGGGRYARELVALAPRQPALREYVEPALEPEQVRIRAELASPKHGTGMVTYRGAPRAEPGVRRGLGLFPPRAAGRDGAGYPPRLGNMAVGRVTEVGDAVTRFREGDRVFGHLPIRETFTVHESRVDPLPAGMSPEAAVCLDPAVMALAMRDAGIRPGDAVAVFGLGAIGLFAVQLARLAGADLVVAVDPVAPRRALALRGGADDAVDPADTPNGDAGLAVRRLAPRPASGAGRAWPETATTEATGMAEELALLGRPRRRGRPIPGGYAETATQTGDVGVDVAIEASGSPRPPAAIRATRFGGTVGVLSYYAGDAAKSIWERSSTSNRLRLISCRAQSLPLPRRPRVDADPPGGDGHPLAGHRAPARRGDRHAGRPLRRGSGGVPTDRRAPGAERQAGCPVWRLRLSARPAAPLPPALPGRTAGRHRAGGGRGCPSGGAGWGAGRTPICWRMPRPSDCPQNSAILPSSKRWMSTPV